MNKQFIFITLLAATALCNGMNENLTAKTDILSTLSITHVLSINLLDNNTAAISDHTNCSIYDLSSNENIKILHEYNKSSSWGPSAKHPNQNLLVIIDNNQLNFFGAKGEKILEKTLPQISIWKDEACFHSTKSIIAIGTKKPHNGLEIWNYETGNTVLREAWSMKGDKKINFHPTKEELFVLTSDRYDCNFFRFKLDPNKLKRINFKIPQNYYSKGTYSHDGSIIALYTEKTKQFLIFNTTSDEFYLFNNDKSEKVHEIKFVPNSFILAILSSKNIYYYNVHNKQCVAITSLHPYSLSYSFFNTNLMDFFDESKLITKVNDACLIIKVPFERLDKLNIKNETLYQPDTKKKCIFILWVLKNYKDKYGNIVLPQELTHLLINKLLETCKYSFTNY